MAGALLIEPLRVVAGAPLPGLRAAIEVLLDPVPGPAELLPSFGEPLRMEGGVTILHPACCHRGQGIDVLHLPGGGVGLDELLGGGVVDPVTEGADVVRTVPAGELLLGQHAPIRHLRAGVAGLLVGLGEVLLSVLLLHPCVLPGRLADRLGVVMQPAVLTRQVDPEPTLDLSPDHVGGLGGVGIQPLVTGGACCCVRAGPLAQGGVLLPIAPARLFPDAALLVPPLLLPRPALAFCSRGLGLDAFHLGAHTALAVAGEHLGELPAAGHHDPQQLLQLAFNLVIAHDLVLSCDPWVERYLGRPPAEGSEWAIP
ncbi:hypothetical protein CGZ93_12590 [Enemella dayhoffiae]|uniref:Uncharacterized protein n=1 Tax=Enemella dayhoffiae TaxID=2016507 RepID=A0A255GW41_9ACTN|nr:hypothetical protein CGZ93_12590 [Enemella dayhoffiae]